LCELLESVHIRLCRFVAAALGAIAPAPAAVAGFARRAVTSFDAARRTYPESRSCESSRSPLWRL
jgi:hypothetical protein